MRRLKNIIVFCLIAVVVFSIIYFVIVATQNVGKTSTTISLENAEKRLNELYKDINVKKANIQRSNAIAEEDKVTILPDISEYPFVVNPTTDNFITVYSSTEKANESEDSWLCTVARNFNEGNNLINDIPVSVGVRAIPSNLVTEFIVAEKYTPDLFMPSSGIYGKILESNLSDFIFVFCRIFKSRDIFAEIKIISPVRKIFFAMNKFFINIFRNFNFCKPIFKNLFVFPVGAKIISENLRHAVAKQIKSFRSILQLRKIIFVFVPVAEKVLLPNSAIART